uniref:Sema domain-containing protein n=1 Tax=Caenorhabditis japonica TaxID=281687 RepID=A0A8R1DGN4_CAEJA
MRRFLAVTNHILLTLILLLFSSYVASGAVNLRPKQSVNSVGIGDRFGGIGTNSDESDHFKLLAADGDSLLVGARNAVYNLSLSSLSVNHKIDWKPPAEHIEECIMKGKSKIDCQNYIRVLARKSAGVSLVCGTHAFSPKCREYTITDFGIRNTRQFDGQGISPYDPRHNSSALYLPENNQLFAATVTDFVGNDALIYRKTIDSEIKSSNIRTQSYDARVLNAPNFVSTFAYKDHVYFWFREIASEAIDNNEESQVYARVARVCKNDKGGARPSNERWTTYLKARLNCSLPSGSSPFYFNELKAVSDPIDAGNNDHVVYTVFSTPDSDVRMSAVCKFSMKKIREEFDNGTFKHQNNAQSMWMAFNRNEVPKPRPGACTPDSTKLPENTVSFILHHPLLHRPIQSISVPLLVEGAGRADLTQITVLPRVKSVSGHTYDVLYIGTSDGKVLKVVEVDGNATVIQSATVFQKGVPIVNLLTTKENVVIVSSDEIASLSVHNCAQQTSCSRCVQLQDPHCAWDSSIARFKLSDRSGVTSLTTLSPDNVFIGCDSGGVYKLNASETDDVSTMHTHLSTVVGIVVAAGVLHSVSLDCAVVSSSVLDSTNPNVSRRPTIIDMPGAMVKSGGGSNLVVVGDGVQILEV